MSIDSHAGGSATARPERRHRLVALAADDLLITLSALAAFAVVAGLTDPQLASEDPAHENDALAFLLVGPPMAVAIVFAFWLTSRDGRTPGGRLAGCRLAARSPTADLAIVIRRYWIALVWLPILVFDFLFLVFFPSFAEPVAFAGPLSVGLVTLVVAASVAAYGWPTGDHQSTRIEDLSGGSFERQPPGAG